jgi:hypothetical protein
MKHKLLSLIWIMTVLPTLGVAAPPQSPASSAAATKTDSAKAPAAVDEYKMDVATLGRLDALLALCAKADEKNRASYERIHTGMIAFAEGTPYEMRVEGSDTPEYKAAYAEAVEAAGKASREELAGQCSRMIGAEVANTEN